MDNLISRQAAIDTVWEHCRNVLESCNYDPFFTDYYKMAYRHVTDVIKKLPSVQPERKPGKWIHERLASTTGGSYPVIRCSECKGTIPFEWETKFCPHCGAKMEG